ncbi:ParH-like protein [Streptomyces sp. NPDC008150]|uniref:ParH-like protein n=1 Tax=Streptomyces sp. NPDC008150 TaxID=3364816 RepID=UPI0036E5E972
MAPDGMPGGRERRRLWRRCRRLVGGLRLPEPFEAAAFLDSVAESRGRPVRLVPVRARPDLPCGLLLTTDACHYVLYTADTTYFHQQHILLHEAAHLLCGHDESAALGTADRALMPSLSPELVRRVLGRTTYSEPQEAEAELVASLILARAGAHTAERCPDTEQDAIAPLFGLPGRLPGRAPENPHTAPAPDRQDSPAPGPGSAPDRTGLPLPEQHGRPAPELPSARDRRDPGR